MTYLYLCTKASGNPNFPTSILRNRHAARTYWGQLLPEVADCVAPWMSEVMAIVR